MTPESMILFRIYRTLVVMNMILAFGAFIGMMAWLQS